MDIERERRREWGEKAGREKKSERRMEWKVEQMEKVER